MMKICYNADLFWIINFILNIFLIYITACLRQKKYTPYRWIIVSGLTSTYTVLVTYLYLLTGRTYLKVCAILVMAVMVRMSYEYICLSQWLYDLLVCLIASIFAAGAILLIKGQMEGLLQSDGDYYFYALLTSIIILCFLFRYMRQFIIRQLTNQRSMVCVTLVHRDQRIQIRALYDTGNHLVSPYTGEPVNVISKEVAIRCGLADDSMPLMIPYYSVGGSGMMRAYRIDAIEFQNGVIKKKVIAAVSEKMCMENDIQMILNIT